MQGLLRVLVGMGYRWEGDFWVGGYDWRRGVEEIVRDANWRAVVDGVFGKTREKVVVVGIGYGCGVGRKWLEGKGRKWVSGRVRKFWCIGGGVIGGSVGSLAAVIDGWGFLEEGAERRIKLMSPLGMYGKDMTANFASMEFEMGLKRKRRKLLPEIDEMHQWKEKELERTNITGESGKRRVRQIVKNVYSADLYEGIHIQQFRRRKAKVLKNWRSLYEMSVKQKSCKVSEDENDVVIRVHKSEGASVYSAAKLSVFFEEHMLTQSMPASQIGEQNPRTEVGCIYGSGMDTPSELTYYQHKDDLADSLELTEVLLEDGDGSVTTTTAREYCSSFGLNVGVIKVSNGSRWDLLRMTEAVREEVSMAFAK